MNLSPVRLLGEDAPPRVVGTVSSLDTLRLLAGEASGDLPADIVEVRLDLVGWEAPDWPVLCERLNERTPVLFTLRMAEEGGRWDRPEQERLSLYREALPRVSGIDIELRSGLREALCREAAAAGRSVVVSYHDFEGTPGRLELVHAVDRIEACPGAIAKIATMLETPEDESRLRALLTPRRKMPLCILGMGPLGVQTRMTYPGLGSCLTYGYLDESAAPGQVHASELRAALHEAVRSQQT
jgi:3-dehydroquinate dehydratase-1